MNQHTAYLRVSTSKQDAAAQWHGVETYAAARGILNLVKITDTASGTLGWHKRSLGDIIANSKTGDVLLTTEISRLGRSTLDVLDCLRACSERGLIVHVIKQGMIVDASLNSKIMCTMLALAAEIERSFISSRTLEGLSSARAAGVQLGRPRGQAPRTKLTSRAAEIAKLIDAGVSVSAIARLTGTSRQTVARFLQRVDTTA